jgi:hypothetical protein
LLKFITQVDTFRALSSFTENGIHSTSLPAACALVRPAADNDGSILLNAKPRIVGGANATSNEFPYQVRNNDLNIIT